MTENPDAAGTYTVADPGSKASEPQPEPSGEQSPSQKGVLRKYIESFDQQTLNVRLSSAHTARNMCCLSIPCSARIAAAATSLPSLTRMQPLTQQLKR